MISEQTKDKPGLRIRSLLIAVPIGVVAAMVTLGFRLAIEGLTRVIFGTGVEITQAMPRYPLYLWPVVVGAGGAIAGLFLGAARHIEKKEKVNTDYLQVLGAQINRLPVRTSLLRGLSSLASIATGASIGREGPMVQLAALAGSLVGKHLLKLPVYRRGDIIAMAAAGGLASVYHAPLASAIFVAEIAFGVTALQRVIPLIIASGSAMIALWLLGYRSPLYPLSSTSFTFSLPALGLTVAIGLAAALAALALLYLIERGNKLFAGLANLPLRLGIGGVLVGTLAWATPDILGNGYEVITKILSGAPLAQALVLLLALKIIATALSAGSGASGGLFTPSLLIGAILGMLMSMAAQALGMNIGPAVLFGAIGMASVLSAVTQAPLMAMLMVLEMTLNSGLLFPMMLATVLAAAIAHRVKSYGAYAGMQAHFHRAEAKYDFDTSLIAELVVPGLTFGPQQPVEKALKASIASQLRYVYITDDTGRFLGVVSIHEIADKILDKVITPDSPMQSVLNPLFPVVYDTQTLQEGWQAFSATTYERLPVLNNPTERKLLGALSKTSLIVKAAEFL